jgi:hypothetical protein
MQSIPEQVAANLPNFPEDIIEQWMGYYAQSDGWPPPNPLQGRWYALLAGRPLSYWRGVEWRLEDLSPVCMSLIAECQDLIGQIIRAHELNESNPYSEFMGAEAQQRFHRLIWFLRTNGILPRPPIILEHRGQYEIMDGNHRFAAYLLWTRWQHKPPFQKEPFPVPLRETVAFWVGYAGAQQGAQAHGRAPGGSAA